MANAESYCSVVDADTYHANFGNVAWAALAIDKKESMLRRATEYMLQFYRLKWKGVRAKSYQALDWPRSGVTLDDVSYGRRPLMVATTIVPIEVQRACASLALTASTEDLAPPLEREVISEKVGPIDTTYRAGSPDYKRYRAIDMMLKIYLAATGSQMVRS